jgi:putative protease
VGDTIEIMKPKGDNNEVVVESIRDEEGCEMMSAPHSKQFLSIKLSGEGAEPYDILRMK